MAEKKVRLPAKDKRMGEEYLIDFDAKNAALRAGYALSTARNAAAWIHPDHPEKPALREYIDLLIARRSRRTGYNADRVVHELAAVAFADITDVVDPETCRLREDIDRSDSAAVASVSVKTGKVNEREVRLHDKVKALELLGRHLGMFKDNVSITGTAPVVICDDVPDAD